MSDQPILREFDDGVVLVTLNRPKKKNAFNDPQWLGFRDALREAQEDPNVAVVVVTGAGNDFSAGQDLTAFGASDGDGETHPFRQCMEVLYAFDKPLMGAAKGVAVGIGATFLFHCDIVYVGESLRLRLPFVSLGLVPEAASSYTLQAAIGSQRAAELFYTAEWIGADRAIATGIAARSFADDALLAAALEKAGEIAKWPVSSLQATKRTLKLAHRSAIAAADEAEWDAMAIQAGSPENVEAITAFIQKREPDFRNLAPRGK